MDLLLIIFISVLFSAFFSGMEIAFVSANKLRLELDKKQNILYEKTISTFTRNPGLYIATMLVGNNIALVIYGLAFSELFKPFFYRFFVNDLFVLLTQTITSTLIILFTAEFLPKALFRINPNSILKFFLLPVTLFYFLFYPISKFSMIISKFLLQSVMRVKIQKINEKIVFSRIDLAHFVSEQKTDDNEEHKEEIDKEVKLFRNALDFSKVKLREVMVPRTEIVAMDINSSVDELLEKFIETGYSRILFYNEHIDNIIGYIHHSVIFNNPGSIRSKLGKVLIVPETMQASKLLHKFVQQRRSIAIVVDEFGGTAGMVTIEDILEEIFGEIEDEHDSSDLIEKKLSDTEYIFSGRLELDDIRAKYNIGFPEEENAETLAGYILFHHENIPKTNTIIDIGKFRIKILKATSTRIELVHLKILENT
jgi:CBS domain containing-hemolysin-like protein